MLVVTCTMVLCTTYCKLSKLFAVFCISHESLSQLFVPFNDVPIEGSMNFTPGGCLEHSFMFYSIVHGCYKQITVLLPGSCQGQLLVSTLTVNETLQTT